MNGQNPEGKGQEEQAIRNMANTDPNISTAKEKETKSDSQTSTAYVSNALVQAIYCTGCNNLMYASHNGSMLMYKQGNSRIMPFMDFVQYLMEK